MYFSLSSHLAVAGGAPLVQDLNPAAYAHVEWGEDAEAMLGVTEENVFGLPSTFQACVLQDVTRGVRQRRRCVQKALLMR